MDTRTYARCCARRSLCAVAVTFAALWACGRAPFHITQSPKIEAYYQRYLVCTDDNDEAGKPSRTGLMRFVFGIRDTDVSLGEFNPERLIVEGSVFFRIVSVPDRTDAFVIEGHGSHVVYFGRRSPSAVESRASATHAAVAPDAPVTVPRGSAPGAQFGGECSDETVSASHDLSYMILASADYRVEDDGPVSVDELQKGSLTVRTSVRSVLWAVDKCQFKGRRSMPPVGRSEVYIRIYLRALAPDVYAIDYSREHDIGVATAVDGPRRLVTPIGSMQFALPGSGRGIFDLRDLESLPIATDYEDLGAGRSWPPGRAAAGPVVEWLSRPTCPSR